MIGEGKTLQGVRVIEYGQMVAAPFCSLCLADAGADVLKVEPPGYGDPARRYGPFKDDIPDQEGSGLFLYLNTHKKGLTLDISKPRGREILDMLLDHCDVFVHDLKPSIAESMGITSDGFRESHPALVVTSITPFGNTGELRDYRMYDLNVFHGGGEGYITPPGKSDMTKPPIKAAWFVSDYYSGIDAASASVAALMQRELTGNGTSVDISKVESVLGINRLDVATPFFKDGAFETRQTLAWPPGMGGVYKCRDGYAISFYHLDRVWQDMIKAMGNPAWAREERFSSRQKRIENGDEIHDRFEGWFSEQTKAGLYQLGYEQGAPVAIVASTEDLFDLRHLKEREFFVNVTHPRVGSYPYPSLPAKFSGSVNTVGRPAPALGQHNVEVYHKQLGIAVDELRHLAWERVI